MNINRNDIITRFPWLMKKNLPMIISADYDGLICAAFLSHYLNWKLEGYYDLHNIWISNKGLQKKKDLIWVDLNILPKQGRAIGGHIVSLANDIPQGFETSCNPNILAKITANEFHKKFPFSTLIYLLWIHNIEIKNDPLAKLLTLHSDGTWLKLQNYVENGKNWQNYLHDYNWGLLFKNITTSTFEKKIDTELYPLLKNLHAVSNKSKLKSKHLKIQSLQYQFNPDWDEDVILHLFKLFGKTLKWTPPKIPIITSFIPGNRKKVPLAIIKENGLKNFLKEKRIFSYAIPSPRIFNFTSFGLVHKSPLNTINETK